MRLSGAQYAEALTLLEKGDVKSTIQNLFAFLRHRGEEYRLGEILAALEKQEEKRTAILSLEVVVAHPLESSVRKKIQEKAERVFPGRQIELHEVLDPEVIGGFYLRGREEAYDATLATTLRAFHTHLKA